MANVSGNTYGLTILSPIIEDNRLDICHSMELRWYLGHLPRDYRSPFAQSFVFSTAAGSVGVRCMRAAIFVGAYSCAKE